MPPTRHVQLRAPRTRPRRTAAEHEARLIESVRQGLAIDSGTARPAREYLLLSARRTTVAEPPTYDAWRVRRVRRAVGVSQSVFAALLNVSGGTVRSWEQGVRVPDGPTRRLLEVAERHPGVLLAHLEHRPSARVDAVSRRAGARSAGRPSLKR
jgi:DNA-binding transcriptional regulator YiaG